MHSVTVGCVAGLIAAAAWVGPALGQDTQFPDFSGLWQRAENASGRTFQPPAEGPGPVADFPDAGAPKTEIKMGFTSTRILGIGR